MSDNPEALPELPDPRIPKGFMWMVPVAKHDYFIADQMRAYARAALAQQAATPTDPAMPVMAWIASGDWTFDKDEAEYWLADPSRTVNPLVRKADADAAIAAARQAATPAPAEPVAWRMRDTGYRRPHFRYYDTREQAEQDAAHTLQSRDDGHLTELTPLYAAPPATPAAQPADEREAFEAWISGTGRSHMLSPHQTFPGYAHDWIQSLWTAWQARAALGSQG